MTPAKIRIGLKGDRNWKVRALWAAALFALALPAWTLYLINADLPVFSNPEVSSMEKWKIWLGFPLITALIAFVGHWG
jgi:hypothetical protein